MFEEALKPTRFSHHHFLHLIHLPCHLISHSYLIHSGATPLTPDRAVNHKTSPPLHLRYDSGGPSFPIHLVVVNFMCIFDWTKGCPDGW